MAAKDVLRNFRDSKYKESPMEESQDDNQKIRSINLTDEETSQFEGVAPGTTVTCTVTGNYQDGKINVMSISSTEDTKQNPEQEMAGQVMQRVMPNVAPSPS